MLFRSDGARLVIPNEKLASDTIRNSTIVSREKVAEITLQVPLNKDLRAVVELLRETVAGEREPDVAVTALNGNATIVVRARTRSGRSLYWSLAASRLRTVESVRFCIDFIDGAEGKTAVQGNA